MTRTDVVLFDLDDTLFDHRRAVDLGITSFRTRLGGAFADAEESERWRALEEEHYHRYLAGELDFLGQRRARARAFAARYGVELGDDDATDRWWDGYWTEYRRNWSLHGDAIRCLDALADRRVGLITNGDLEFQTTKVREVGLAHRVEHVVASGALGIAKPDPRIFAHACALFGVEPSAATCVGDRLHTDAIGAASAGLLGVWIDRRGVATDADRAEAAAAGVPIIRSLDGLPSLLR